jgi:signal transduction histidine kinase
MSPDTLDLRLIVRRLVDDTLHRLASDAAILWLRGADGSELDLSHAAGLQHPATVKDLTHRPAARVDEWLVAKRLPAVVTLKRKDVAGERAWLEAEDVHSLLAVPVIAEGTPLGILAAFRRRRPFPVGSVARAAGMAATAAPGVHAAQRLAQQRQRAERAEMLLAITQALVASSDLEAALAETSARIAGALGAARCDVRLGTAFSPVEPGASSASELVVPIARNADVIGSLTFTGPPRTGWTPQAVELATAIATQIALAAEHSRLSADAQKQVQGETLRALADLAGGAAHHLNNLLTIVVGRVQLVLRSTDDERVLRPLTIVEKAAKDGAEVVRRLQQFSRMRQVARPRPVNLDDVVREALAGLHAGDASTGGAAGAGIEVESRFGDVPPVAGDAVALREALTDVILNAVDAMPNGGRLLVETRATDSAVTVAVSDTGVGMSDGVQFRAQEPFFTTKGVKATGLGLSVAYGIVRSHGGAVAIRSAEGAGTTVTVTLPRATTGAEVESLEEPIRGGAGPRPARP